MMMMQEIFDDDENHRALNYTKIDRCQDNLSIDNDEYYRQISSSNEYLPPKQKIRLPIHFINHIALILFILLLLTSQTNALPIYARQSSSPNLPIAMVQLTDRSVYSPQTFNVYRRFPNPMQQQIHRIPPVQIYESSNVQNQQLRRERQRRAMVDKMITMFDDDGMKSSRLYSSICSSLRLGNGQLTSEELYSMALRSNIFPKFHHYLKQTSASN